MNTRSFSAIESELGKRLDKVLAVRFPDHARQYFQKLIAEGHVTVNGKLSKPSYHLMAGDQMKVHFPPPKEIPLKPTDISLDIVYEDENVLVINKPAGLVVHPGVHGAHAEDSMVNAILHYGKGKLGGISGSLRPGIVHRLDKDTSGLLVVAKNDKAQKELMDQFVHRTVDKVYYALLAGHLEPAKGTIEAPIGRSSADRKKMAVSMHLSAKEAFTKYQVMAYYGDYTYVKVFLLTGRTHQIRVHFAAIGFPIVGDATYGREKVNEIFLERYELKRQFLHAGYLSFTLPGTHKKAEFSAPLPPDLQSVLDGLAKH